MRLDRIYSSKLYLTSSRQDKIHAAMSDPMNQELVQQIFDYLAPESKKQLDNIIKGKEREARLAEKADNLSLDNDNYNEKLPDDNNVFSPSYSGGGPSLPPSDFDGGMGEDSDIFDTPDGETDDLPDLGGEPEPAPEAPVEEATTIYGKVTAETDLDAVVVDVASECNTIKGTLNAREDTAGVLRIAIDDDELWIYYKDEVNIGDIMVNVIEVLNGTNYTYLTFSRLARSNNAIVFDINLNTNEPIKTVKEIEEENK